MSDSHDHPQTGVNDAAIILPIAAMILILSIIPPAILLLSLRIVHRKSQRPHTLRLQDRHTYLGTSAEQETAEYFCGGVRHEGNLPAVEQPTEKWAHHDSIFRRAREVVLKFHDVAIVGGGAIALRFREVFENVRGRTLGFVESYRRRRDGNADDGMSQLGGGMTPSHLRWTTKS